MCDENTRFTLTLTEKQADVVCAALDFYTRMCIGQIEELVYLVRSGEIPVGRPHSQDRELASPEVCEQLEHLVMNFKHGLGYPENGSNGIGHPHVAMSGRRAYEIQKVLQKAVAECRDPDPSFRGVNYDGLLLRYTQDPAPKNAPDPESQIKELIEINWKEFSCVPVGLRSLSLSRFAVKQDWKALEYVPERFKTHELCEIAVKQNGLALEFIPAQSRTPELCRMAVQQGQFSLAHFPESYITPELCLAAVRRDAWAIHDIPDSLKTPEICRIAVEQDGCILKYVPSKLITEELRNIAARNTKDTLANPAPRKKQASPLFSP